MAKPRVFVSSTYFDLQVIRADIARFLKEIGYEAVLFERGHVPYGKDSPLEEYCYNEISSCDIVISIIGGRFGSQARDSKNSITQTELKTAIDHGKQVYIFVEKPVHSEYRTYEANKDLKEFRPVSVDNIKIFQFIDTIYSLQKGNPVEPFETSEDIIKYLKEQWAGLFQRLLQDTARQIEVTTIDNLKSITETLNNLVKYVTEENSKGIEGAVKDILLSNHPAFATIKNITQVPYRVVFYSLEELDALLTVRQYTLSEDLNSDGYLKWENEKSKQGIAISPEVFDESNNLKVISPADWKEDWIKKYDIPQPISFDDFDDDIPF